MEWTRCGSNCGSASRKQKGWEEDGTAGAVHLEHLSAWRPQLCPGHFTLIVTHTDTYTHTHLHIYLCPRSMHISMHKTSRHTLLLSLTSEQAFRQKWTEIPPGVTRRGGLPLPSVTRAGRVRVTSLNGGHCNLGSSGAPVRPGVRQLKWGCASRLHPLQKNNKTKRTRHHTKILQNLGQSRLLKNTRKKL